MSLVLNVKDLIMSPDKLLTFFTVIVVTTGHFQKWIELANVIYHFKALFKLYSEQFTDSKNSYRKYFFSIFKNSNIRNQPVR